MVHTFTALGVYIAVDVNSGAVHVLDKDGYDTLNELISLEGQHPSFDRRPEDLGEAWEDLKELYDQGLLFVEDDYLDPAAAVAMQRRLLSRRSASMSPTTAICAANTALPPPAILAPESA